MRSTRALHRRPGGTAWEEMSLDKAMDMIAERVKNTRDELALMHLDLIAMEKGYLPPA